MFQTRGRRHSTMAWLSIHRYEPDKESTFFAAEDLMRTEWFRLRRSAIVQLSRHICQGYDLRPASLCITEWSDYRELFREVREELRNPTQAPRCKVSSPSWASIAIIDSTRLSDTTRPSFLDLVCRMISRRPIPWPISRWVAAGTHTARASIRVLPEARKLHFESAGLPDGH